MSPSRLIQILALSTFVASIPLGVRAATLDDPLDRPALKSALAPRAVMLDLVRTGSRLVAVGERGIVLLSDDEGRNWRQADVPLSVSLTAASFADARTGWAVGHSGVILKTTDGGEHWTIQLDGRRIAEQLAKSGKLSEMAAERWQREGADKPFLALHVVDDKSIQAVGAFGLAFRTRDGGATWEYFGDKLDNPKANHLYAIVAHDRQMSIAGEQGAFFTSADGGASFKRMELPYKGSLFELHQTAKGLFATGMKGKLLFTPDHGKTWKEVVNPIPVSLLSVVKLAGGKQLWLNQAGQFLAGGDDDRPLAPLQGPMAPGATRIALTTDKHLVTAGFIGLAVQPWNP